MDYYKLLKLKREPFSNSPDPVFFFKSRRHLECLQQLELSVRLRRGLNVVIGNVGTGKTTLCHQLIRQFDREKKFKSFLMLDPSFNNPRDFLLNVAAMFLEEVEADASDWELKEKIKHYLFTKGVSEEKIILLIIDEGQKISYACLELLREFLNYETNQYKLLQIIIFAQDEFADALNDLPNFADRINHCHVLGPLDFRDTKAMIQFRLLRAGGNGRTGTSLFNFAAMFAVYRATGGYPRKVINLCHKVTLALIIQDRSRGGWFLVRSCIQKALPGQSRKWQWAAVTAIGITAALLLLPFSPSPYKIKMPWNWHEETQAFTSVDTLHSENHTIRIKIDKNSLDLRETPSVSRQIPWPKQFSGDEQRYRENRRSP
ncbi:MAG: ExeA family protein [Thermodesulfobacteriota bacterium]